jgi:predicted permease
MQILADLKYSARSLVRAPGLALALLLTIAIGVGSNAAVLGFVRGFVSRDIPLAGSSRLVSIYAREGDGAFGPLSAAEVDAVAAQTALFDRVGAIREAHASVVLNDRLSVLPIASVTPEVAELLELGPASPRGVVISHRLSRTEFGGRTDLRDQLIRIDGREAPIAGVAPEWLEGLYVDRAIDVWVPFDPLPASDAQSRTLWVLGQLRPGVSIADAQTGLATGAAGRVAMAVQPYTGATPEAGAGLARISRSLVAAAIAVFFMACANVAAFLLSRASTRSHETSVRVALGASRVRLRQQLLADSALVAVAGGACGLLLAFWTMDIVPALFFDQDAEQLVFAPDVKAIVVAAAACAAIMTACGLVPLFQVKDDRPEVVLRREGRGPSNAMRRLRGGLVVAQMACCSLLVISTALLIDTFHAALRTTASQRLGDPLLATVDAAAGFDNPGDGLAYFHEVESAARGLPGALGAAWMETPPGSRPSWRTVRVEPPGLPLQDVVMDVVAFTPDWIDRIAWPPRAGRAFARRDSPQSCRVAIVNHVAAETFFDNDAVGRAIEDPANRRVEIIGVVATPRPEHARPLIFYYPEQTPLPLNTPGPGRFRVPVRPSPTPAVLAANVVSPSYFDAIALPVTDGRGFDDPAVADGCRVGVLNEEAAQLYFGGRAVGGAIVDSSGQRTAIVGVVRSRALRLSERRSGPALYVPMSQDYTPRMTLVVGSRSADDDAVQMLRSALTDVEGGTIRRVTSLDRHLSVTALAPERIAATLVGASAAMALALGVLGMYSAMADSTRQRRREIALRIALGARSWGLIRQVLAEGFAFAIAGSLAGVVGSMLVSRWLELTPPTMHPGLWVFVMAPLALVAAVLAAGVLPMRRALDVDPLSIMRDT